MGNCGDKIILQISNRRGLPGWRCARQTDGVGANAPRAEQNCRQVDMFWLVGWTAKADKHQRAK